MKKTLLILIASFLAISCSKKSKFEREFMNGVWIIDSTTTKLPDGKKYLTPSKQILKVKPDSTFGLYRDQTNQFEKFYFKNDSIFLNKVNSKFWNSFKYEFLNDNEVKLKSDNNLDYRITLTNLSDLFDGKVDNSNSKLYQRLNKKVWYPIYFSVGNDVRYNDKDRYTESSYYLKENAFVLDGDKATFPFIDGKENDKYYRFKYTENGLYIYDTESKQLVLALQAKIEDKGGREYVTLLGNLGFAVFKMELKEIDPNMLKSINDLSKKERLGCNEFTAEDNLKSFLKEKSDGILYYDTSKMKLLNKNEENCSYDFSVKEISRELSSLYTKVTFRITFLEDGNFKIKRL